MESFWANNSIESEKLPNNGYILILVDAIMTFSPFRCFLFVSCFSFSISVQSWSRKDILN